MRELCTHSNTRVSFVKNPSRHLDPGYDVGQPEKTQLNNTFFIRFLESESLQFNRLRTKSLMIKIN